MGYDAPMGLRTFIVSPRLWAALCAALVVCSATAQSTTSTSRYEAPSGDPEHLTGTPIGLYFSADDGVYGRELWFLPGAEGEARMVKDVRTGSEGTIINKITPVGDRVVMDIGNPGSSGFILSDSTLFGTRDIAIEEPGIGGRIQLDDVIGTLEDGRIAITTEETGNVRGLWTLAPGEQFPVPMLGPDEYGNRLTVDQPTYAILGNRIVFPGSRPTATGDYVSGLWITDGTLEGTRNLHRFLESPAVVFKFTDELVLFEGNTDEMGSELWISDGTPEGTQLVKELWPGPDSSSPGEMERVPEMELAYFAATDPEHGRELWITDGTEAGTRLVKDINPGENSSEPYKFEHSGQQLFFIASSPGRGRELWVSRGTEDSTFMVKDINPGPSGSEPYEFCIYRNILYFSAREPEHGEELWRSDGTPEGTWLLEDVNPGPEGSVPYYTTVAAGHVFFAATHQLYGRELWVTTGQKDGTRMVVDLQEVGQVNPSSSPSGMTATPKLMFFAADDVRHGMELWVTDGTAAGTRMVRDIFPGRASSTPEEFLAFDDLVFFRADDGTHGSELWVSDGTELGTKLVADLAQTGGSGPKFLTRLGDKIVFRAYTEAFGTELYIADRNGAEVLTDINVGPTDSNPSDLVVWQDKLYFRADDGVHGEELWVTEGRKDRTRMVTDIVAVPVDEARISEPTPFQGDLYYARGNLSNGRELWRLRPGESIAAMVRDIAVPAL